MDTDTSDEGLAIDGEEIADTSSGPTVNNSTGTNPPGSSLNSITINNADGTTVVIPLPFTTSGATATAAGPVTGTAAIAGITANSVYLQNQQPQVSISSGTDRSDPQQQQQQPQVHRIQINQRTVPINSTVSTAGFGPNLNINRPSVTIGGTTNGRSSTQSRGLPPLEPRPVMTNASTMGGGSSSSASVGDSEGTNDEGVDDERLDRFKCSICYEFLQDPSSCGSCASRFCRVCLERCRRHEMNVIRRQAMSRNMTPGQQQQQEQQQQDPKCPTCRVPYKSVVPDVALRTEMLESGPQLPCRYDGCTEILRIPQISKHELICDHVPVYCRYAPYGCKWTGKRKDVATHESSGDCALAGISEFVDAFRKLDASHSAKIDQTFQRVSSLYLEHRGSVQRQSKSLYDLLSVFHFVYLVIAATPHVQRTGSWYLSSFECNAGVTNIVMMAPLFLVGILMASTGLSRFFVLLDKLHHYHTSKEDGTGGFWNEKTIADAEECLLWLCFVALMMMFVTVNIQDSKSSLKWEKFRLRYLGKGPVLGDIFALLCFVYVLVVIDTERTWSIALILWCSLNYTTILMPIVLWHTNNWLVGRQAPRNTFPRCMPQVQFGLRYGLLASFFSIAECMDAIAMSRLLLPHRGRWAAPACFRPGSQCFLDQVPNTVSLLYLGIRIAHLIMVGPSKDGIFARGKPTSLLEVVDHDLEIIMLVLPSILCTLALVGISSIFYYQHIAGNRLAILILREAKLAIRRNHLSIQQPPKDYTSVGILTFASWVWTLLVICRCVH